MILVQQSRGRNAVTRLRWVTDNLNRVAILFIRKLLGKGVGLHAHRIHFYYFIEDRFCIDIGFRYNDAKSLFAIELYNFPLQFSVRPPWEEPKRNSLLAMARGRPNPRRFMGTAAS